MTVPATTRPIPTHVILRAMLLPCDRLATVHDVCGLFARHPLLFRIYMQVRAEGDAYWSS